MKYEIIETCFILKEKIIALVDTEKSEAICSFYINGSYSKTLKVAEDICAMLNKKNER
jgi:hypothetical protein